MITILKNNGGLVFNSNNKNTFDFFTEYIRHKTFTDYFKIDTFSMPREVLDTIKINMKYLERLKRENMLQNNNKTKSSGTFSPTTDVLKAIFPSTWDISAFGNYQIEINNINNYIAGYGYEHASQIDFIYDATASDNVCGNLTYNAVKNISNVAGILLVGTHGRPPNDPDPTHLIYDGFFLWFATTESAIYQWCNNDPLVHPTPVINKPNGWLSNIDLWGAFVHTDWVDTYWKNNLLNNNTITILSSCYSYTNRMVESCKGGIAFGYDNLSYQDNSIENEKQLFKQMNGIIDNGQYREASEAYNNMPVHYDNFKYKNSCPITLCPAAKSKYPEEATTVGLQGDGWFEVDTYCDASIPINDQDFNHSPIAFEWTNPGLSITNVHWDDPDGDGLSNKIIYHWESTVNNTVTVKINHNYWQSAPSVNNQYHLLDYDKVTPNSEDGQYSFNISNTIPTQPPVADFSYTVSGNTAYFQDQSTNTPTSWQWNFGDGQNSTSQNVQHSYSSTGTYSVTLMATNTFGSSSKTKSVSITSTPQTVTVSGVVQNFDNFVPIAGATVSCSYASTTTNASGYYSLQVPYNVSNCGVITASAPGFQSSSTCSCNNLISDKSCDFNLFAYCDVEIKCTSNPDNQICNGHTSRFEAIYQNITAINHYWYVDGIYIDYTHFSNIWQTTLNVGIGYHTIRVEVETDNGEILYDELEVHVNNCTGTNCYYDNIMIQQSCEVVNVGTTVHYYEIFPLSEACKEEVKRDWVIGFGAPDEKIFSKKSFNEVEHYDIDYAFSVAGPKTIALRYYVKNIWGNYNNIFHDVWTGISVINCNYDSYYLPPSFDFFTMAVFNDSYNPARLYGGRNVYIDGKANNYLNMEDINVFACNEIVLNGDIEFIANGNHELILENYNSPCINNSLLVNKNDFKQSKVNDNFSFIVFPNPFKNNINILIDNTLYTEIIIEINDILGKNVLFTKEKITSGEHLFSFNTELLMHGTYIIKMLSNEFSKSVKIIKQ